VCFRDSDSLKESSKLAPDAWGNALKDEAVVQVEGACVCVCVCGLSISLSFSSLTCEFLLWSLSLSLSLL